MGEAAAAEVVGVRTVLCHGCFDYLHLGHIRHLKEARELGDRLVVSVTADRFVRKGDGRPQFSAEQRREALLAIGCVDEVVISDEPTAIEMIRKIRPAVYVKGVDYAGRDDDAALAAEREAVESVGGRFHVTTTEKWSSTELLRSVRLSEEAFAYVESAKKRGFLSEILEAMERADSKRILFVGETIIDEYRYVKPLAKPSKEFVLATKAVNVEQFDGGTMAAARHGEWMGAYAVTYPAVKKVRFVDADFFRKLFEVYEQIPVDLADNGVLAREVRRADVVVALDFGHGFFDFGAKQEIQKSSFLAMTVQSNAGNYGFNLVTKHHRADYVVIDEPEARLAAHDQTKPVPVLLREIRHKLYASHITITCGRRGSVSESASLTGKLAEPVSVPAFTDSGKDTMGAGDAFLAVAGPLVAVGLDVEKAAFVGNVAGGLKTSIIGHRRHVTRQDIVKNLEWLLK